MTTSPGWIVTSLLVFAPIAGTEPGRTMSFIAEGSPLPAFKLQRPDGTVFASKDLAGKPGVLVFLRPGQPGSLSVLRLLRRLQRELGDTTWEQVGIVSGDVSPDEAKRLATTASFSGHLLLDPERKAYALLGVVAVPSLAVFDDESRIVYSRPGAGADLFLQLRTHIYRTLGKPIPGAAQDGAARKSAPEIALARALIEEGNLGRAETLLRQALEEESSPAAYFHLGEVLLRRKQARAALALLEEARKLHPAPSRLDIGLARALAALGRDAEAERLLLRHALRVPHSWEAHAQLGEIYEKGGKSDLAMREYRKAIAIMKKLLGDRSGRD
jgi:tetratricopeptide (TPR) repeat protein